MSGLNLTRGDVITQGLEKAARPDLVSDARLWLNLFLEEMYYNQDWHWLVKSADGLAVIQGGSLPDFYRSAKAASIISNGDRIPLRIITDRDEWEEIKRNTRDTTGVPNRAFVDMEDRKMYFAPTPSGTLLMDLSYYYIPQVPNHRDPENDDELIKWELPYNIIIDYIKAMAMEYNDDLRQDKAMATVEKKLAQYKFNAHDKRAGSNKLALGKSFRKRRGHF